MDAELRRLVDEVKAFPAAIKGRRWRVDGTEPAALAIRNCMAAAPRLANAVERLDAECARLREELADCIETAECFGVQVDEYLQEKWGFAERMAKHRAALARADRDPAK